MSGPGIAAQSDSEVSAQVFLVCAAQLVTVDRTVRVPEKGASDRARIAQALLDELAAPPSEPEKDAGFATDVRGGTSVSGPAEGDPKDALRFSTPPQELSAFALAQIVCTLADSAAGLEGPHRRPGRPRGRFPAALRLHHGGPLPARHGGAARRGRQLREVTTGGTRNRSCRL